MSIVRSALTSCVVLSAGDSICQTIQRRRSAAKSTWKHHDVQRTGRFATVGLTLHGPYFFKGFQWIDAFMGAGKNLQTALMKTALGQVTVFPIYLALFYSYMGTLEGKKLPEIIEKTQERWLPAVISGSVFWPSINVLNFMVVPAQMRVLYVGIMGLVWNAYLSWLNSASLSDLEDL